jgi:hypothetical protein
LQGVPKVTVLKGAVLQDMVRGSASSSALLIVGRLSHLTSLSLNNGTAHNQRSGTCYHLPQVTWLLRAWLRLG